MKKYLSMILIVALLISSVPISAADVASPLFTYAANYSGYTSFEDFIVAQSLPLKVDNFSTGKTLYINKSVYDKYGLIVYGNEKIINYDMLPAGYPHENSSAEEIYNDQKTGTTGYRYLGYSQGGQVVTNAYYPPDAPLSDKNKWIEQYSDIANAQDTWSDVTDGSLREYMTAHWIGGNGINTDPNDINTQYTVETINNTRSMGALNTYPIDGYSDSYMKTLLLTAGGWYTNFSVRTERGKYYQTWIGDGMASNARVDQWLTLNLQNNDIAVTMASDQQFVEVNTSYTAVIVPDNQFMKKEHVKQFEASISKDGSVIDSSEAEFSVLRKTVNRTVRINRSELAVGTQEVEISGSYVLDTVFKSDPKKSGNLTRKVIVTVEEPAVPTASCLVTANPRYKTSSGSDVDVSITADISLYKVTTANVANIAVWLDGECQYASVINPTVTFHRTIDGAPFVDNPDKRIKQPWNVTVSVTLKDGRVLEASGDDMTVVVGEPKPPEVKVNAPKTAKVGDTKGITVRGSSVTGALDYLILNDGSADIVVEHPTDGYLNTQYEFTREGEQTFTGVAIDTLGYSGYGEDTTMVLPPTVDAVIHTEGQLKPYRKITVSSMQSDSPDKFPIVDSQTDWWVSSGTINAASGVYSPADPDGSRKFDFGVPTAGTINMSVTLKNPLGYSGQASKTITIAPDEPPVAVMELVNKVYRNPNDANNATISVINRSYSPDGDKIGLLSVMYWYDSDNDGNYYEHPVHLVYQGANMPQVDFKVSSVGKYMIRTRVDETYTAMSGMTPVYLYDTTYDGYFDEKHVVEVDNIAPSVNAQVTNDNEPVTINYFNINGYTTDAYIQSQFASQLTPILNSNGYATLALETHDVASVEKTRTTTAIGAPVESTINYYSVGKYIPEINMIEGARVLYYLNANRTGIARTFRYVNYERVKEKNTGDREWKQNVGREHYYYNLSDKQIMVYAYVNDNDVGYEINGGFINFPYGTGVYVFDYYLNIANYYSSFEMIPEDVMNKFIFSDYMTDSMLYPEDDYYSYASSGVRTNKRFGYTTPTDFTSSTSDVWPINKAYKILNSYTTRERISGYNDTIYNNFWNYEWYNSLVDYINTIKANSFETLGKKVAVLAFKEPEQLLGNDDYINALASLLSTNDVLVHVI
ncbi:hypothetical protein KHM83_08020 [Fusibacter paucivorans]|uniref:Uncharacterized protein n=1 Tax=Fusibacter paucivorans TaxID=76009 RepID=A0ABS5PN60_9FIRM|nr:hypothetical protein [Fusibacter paucivorans]MBS7526619.1 hypothetical protein [Fusibacter paucivorans]